MNRATWLAMLAAIAAAPRAIAQSCPAGPHALVLSGGAARGFAQLGALGVLDSMGRRADLVVGTSVGAILGALYAGGRSARDMQGIAAETNLAGLFADPGPVTPRAFGSLTPILVWEEHRGGLSIFSSSRLESRLNARLNAALLEANLAAGGDFGRLPVPLAVIAADLASGETIMLRTGDMVHAVRASMGIPLVFRPLRHGTRWLIDGGMADNVPVDPARSLGAASLTVIDVTAGLADTVNVQSVPAIARHFLDRLMADERDSLGPGDVRVRPDLAGFGHLDFSRRRLAEAIRLGADAARSTLAAAGCMPRRAGGSPIGPFMAGDVRITALREADRRLIHRSLGLRAGDSVNQGRIRRMLRAMERSPEPRELWLNPRHNGGRIDFDIVLTPPARRVGAILLGYDHDQGARIGGILTDRSPLGGYAQLVAGVTAARFQQSGRLTLRPEPVSWNPWLPALHLRIAHEAIRAYPGGGDPITVLGATEAEAHVALEKVARRWRFSAGPMLHTWKADSAHGTSPGFGASAGRGSELRRPFMSFQGVWTTDWTFAAAAFEAEHNGGWWRGRLIARGTTTHRAPPQRLPALGGSNGFPGYGLFDLRGTDEAYGELSASAEVFGPFQGRVAVAGGRSWNSHTDDWLGGLRLTLELPTPAGALRGGYGRASTGEGAVFVRLGAWF